MPLRRGHLAVLCGKERGPGHGVHRFEVGGLGDAPLGVLNHEVNLAGEGGAARGRRSGGGNGLEEPQQIVVVIDRCRRKLLVTERQRVISRFGQQELAARRDHCVALCPVSGVSPAALIGAGSLRYVRASRSGPARRTRA